MLPDWRRNMCVQGRGLSLFTWWVLDVVDLCLNSSGRQKVGIGKISYFHYYNNNNNNNKVFESQTSWGRLELKPSRSNQGSGTWIAVFKHSYLRLSLWVYSILSSLILLHLSKSTLVFLCLSSRYYPDLGFHYAILVTSCTEEKLEKHAYCSKKNL